MNQARGMPDVSLSKETQEFIEEEKKLNEKKPENEIFDTPKLEPKQVNALEVKPIENLEPLPPPAVKPKKKLTEKQLEALAKGRQKSIETRRKNKEEKLKAKIEKDKQPEPPTQFHYQEPPPIPPPQQQYTQAPQTAFIQPTIDYDKIINGVANIYEQRNNQKLKKIEDEQIVNNNVLEFENKIREDERLKVLKEYEERVKKQRQEQNLKTTKSIYSRPQVNNNDNPYAYAFAMNSRNQFKRY